MWRLRIFERICDISYGVVDVSYDRVPQLGEKISLYQGNSIKQCKVVEVSSSLDVDEKSFIENYIDVTVERL